jgi:site-specific DNA-methyltransferase (adenine-specific)
VSALIAAASPLDVLEGRSRFSVTHGNALALLQTLPDACVDAVCTDPPYSSGGMFRADRAASTGDKYVLNGTALERPDFVGDSRDQRSFQYWMALWLYEAMRVTKPGGAICCFCDWRQIGPCSDAIQSGGWIYRGIVPWDKTEGVRPSMGRFAAQCEYILWGTHGARGSFEEIGCLPGIVRAFPKPSEKHHQTGKPVAVLQELVKIAPVGGIILDPFHGGGSTTVAALREGRRCISFELVPEYVQIGRVRAEAELADSTPQALAAKQGALFG